MSSDFLTLTLAILSVYLGVAVFMTYYIVLRRERRRASDAYGPEASRWIEAASSMRALGWNAPAAMLATNALELTLRGVSKKRSLDASGAPLTRLITSLAEEGVIDRAEADRIFDMLEIRNLISHGRADEVPQEQQEYAYQTAREISEKLLLHPQLKA